MFNELICLLNKHVLSDIILHVHLVENDILNRINDLKIVKNYN